MSKLKIKKISLFIMLMFCSALFFACGNKTPVESIHFADSEIVLLQGDSFTPNVEISPGYATNKNYILTSSNPEIVVVNSKSITALKEGEVIIRAISEDNPLHEDVLKVVVTKTKSTLLTPRVSYNNATQTFNFDTITNAAAYSIRINGQVLNLGNNTSFSLADFEKDYSAAYDRVLNVQVKAIAPTYSHAYEDSEFSSAINIYQASAPKNVSVVGGVLNFDKTVAEDYRVNLGLTEFTTSLNSVNLLAYNTATDEFQTLSLTALVNESVKQPGVTYYNSLPVDVRVYSIAKVQTNQIGNVVSWQNNLNVKAYQLFVDDVLASSTTNDFFNFSDLPNYSSIGYMENGHTFKIMPVLKDDCVNVLSSVNANAEFKFNRMPTPELTVLNNVITWIKSDLADLYSVEINYGDNTFKTTIMDNSFDLNNFPSNEIYSFSVVALGKVEDMFYLASIPAEKQITKNATVTAKIEDYRLKFATVVGDNYKIEFTDNEYASLDVVADSNQFELDLTIYNFAAGLHKIAITHLGNGAEIFDSATTYAEFVQLEDNADLTIANSTITVETTDINKEAQIKLQILGDGIDLMIVGKTHTINSTLTSEENYLPAGDYVVYLYILGDGANTFSIQNSGKSVTTSSFKVLPPPQLKQVNKTLSGFTFEEMIAGAINYNLFVSNGGEFVKMEDLDFDFDNFPIYLKLQSVGNGVNTINSRLSDVYEIYKLVKPELQFDKTSGIISKTDANSADIVLDYVLTQNGTEISYDFTTPFTDFAVGENEFSLTAIAIDPMGNKFYLNSEAFVLNINLINVASDVTINSNNQLEIVPTDQTEELNLTLTFVFDDEMTFETSGNSLVCGDITLNYKYVAGKYVVDLLREDLTPIIPEMTTNFAVKFKFASTDNKTVNSAFSSPIQVVLEDKTSVAREGQFLTVHLVKQTDKLENYALFINDNLLLEIPASSTIDTDNQLIKIDVNEIFNQLDDQNSIVSINAITKNSASAINSPRLSVKGEKAYFTHANSVELTSTKNNLNENNSVVISFNPNTQAISKTYEVYVYNMVGGEKINLEKRVFAETGNNLISFNLDDFNLLGTIYVDCIVLTTSTLIGEQNVMMFNSIVSNCLQFDKIESVENIYVADGILHFDLVENAVGYEVYKITNGAKTKLNTNLITTNSYDISSVSGQEVVAVKAISTEGFTNSNLSEGIVINKTSIEKLDCASGVITLTLSNDVINLFKQESVDIVINVKNGTNEFNLNSQSEGVEIADNKLIIQPYTVLSYGANSLLLETLTFQIKVNYTAADQDVDVYYLNSNTQTVEVYGVFAPTDLKKHSTETDTNEIVENITFTPSAKNFLNGEEVGYGFTFKLKIDDKIYLSTDKNLKYYNKLTDTFESYPSVILGSSFIFPAGYDRVEDGQISKDEEFAAGNYTFSVQTVAKTVENLSLLNSAYSQELTFTIMESPTLSNQNGEIVWQTDSKADKYIVRIYENDFETVREIDNVTQSSFDFANEIFNDYVGIFGVTVQAISSNSLIVNSAESEMFVVYRMPAVTNVKIDDGNLVISANRYFNNATITFVDKGSNRSETIIFENIADANDELSKLGLTDWKEFDLSKEGELALSKNYIVTSLTNEILNIMANRSYNINIRLHGNSNSNLAIVNSKTVVNSNELLATKLATSLTETKLGVVQFKYISDYEGINLNYNFNNQLAENVSPFWQTAKLFKITITTNKVVHSLYALDYESFVAAIEAGSISASEYGLLEDKGDLYAYYIFPYSTENGTKYLYFNVFKNNSLNLRENDYLYYYPITTTQNNGEINFVGVENENNFSHINIADGGTFVMGVSLVGGDSYTQTNSTIGYLTSNENVLKTFVRYGENFISTLNGRITFNELLFVDEKTGEVLDYPIYKIGVNSINSTDVINYYLYYNNITREQALEIVGEENADNLMELLIDEQGNLLFDFSTLFEAGAYQVNIRTLAGPGKGSGNDVNYLLNAKLPSTNYPIRKISSTEFGINNGVLSLNLAHVASSTGNIYIYDYEITLTDSETKTEYVYQIGRNSAGVKISNNVLSYEIPSSVLVGNNLVQIVNGKNYEIKVKALANDNSQYLVNASYPSETGFTFRRSLGVSELNGEQPRISGGKLIWKVLDIENYSQVKIRLSYYDENDQLSVITFTRTGERFNNSDGSYAYHYYEFTDGRYDLENSSAQVYINPDIDYSLSISVLGNNDMFNSIINSAFSTSVTINRLQMVDTQTVVASNGVLTWQKVPNAVNYYVTLTGTKTYTFTTKENEIDFATVLDDNSQKLEQGNYTISIRAIGDNYITSMLSSSTRTFQKLEAVENIRIDNTNRNQIIWDKVDMADGYKITFKYFVNGEQKVESTITDKEEIVCPADLTGTYSVEIVACGVGISYVFNSEVSTYISSKDRPNPVGSIYFDDIEQRYYWATAEDFLPTDNLRISFNFEEYVMNNGSIELVNRGLNIRTIRANDFNSRYISNGITYYFFKPTVMGVYSDFTVQVEREDSIYSSTSRGANKTIDFYAYGAGTSENPYRIQNATHLLNIELNKNANYELISSIDMSGVDIVSRINKFGAVLADNFTGVINGNNFVINGINNVQLTNQTSFALFKELNGATISNLTVGQLDVPTVITYSFAKSMSDVIRLSMIATNAENSTLSNISINKTTFVLSGAGIMSGRVYLAGLLGTASNSEILGCNVNLSVEFNADFTGSTWIGGAIANAVNTSIDSNANSNEVSLTVSQARANRKLGYVGGVVGQFEGDNDRTYIINNTNSTVNFQNIYADYLGGLVGLVSRGRITNCQTSGTISNSRLNTNTYIGGVAGSARSAIIENSGTRMEFDLVVTNSNQAIYVGVIAGGLSTTGNINCLVTSCYASYEVTQKETTLVNGTIKLGIYGTSTNNYIDVDDLQIK